MGKKRQPFMVFLQEHQARDRKNGIHHDITHYQTTLGDVWAKMDEAARKPYKERAKGGWAPVPAGSIGFTQPQAEQASVPMVVDPEAQILQLNILRGLINEIVSSNSKCILSRKWVSGVSNILVRTRDTPRKYLPLEFGFASYSIEEGIESHFHSLINPGEIPLGYHADAQAHARDFHKLPISPVLDYAIGARETEDVRVQKIEEHLIELLLWLDDGAKFLLEDGTVKYFIFGPDEGDTEHASCEQLKKCLETLAFQTGNQELIQTFCDQVEVAPLSLLLTAIVSMMQNTTLDAISEDSLLKAHYDYHNGRCHYHLEADNKHCALGIAKKMWYLFSDYILPFVCLEGKAGKHFPQPTSNIRVEETNFPGFDFPNGISGPPRRATTVTSYVTASNGVRNPVNREDQSRTYTEEHRSECSSLSGGSRRLGGIGRGQRL